MLKVLGYETLDALIDAAVPGSVRSLDGTRPAGGAVRARGARRAAPARLVQHDRRADDRPRLLRDDHAGRDPAQRLGEPGLVHGLHPVPTRDQPGTPRGALELPDHGVGPHGARHGQRLPARREHRGGGGRHPHAPARHRRGQPGRRGCRLPPADRSRCCETRLRPLGIEVDVVDLDATDPAGRLLRRGPAVPGVLGRHPRLRRADRGGPRPGRAGGRGHRPRWR